jgi:23S rRNA pseudouridine1911/1915/1917 synthase
MNVQDPNSDPSHLCRPEPNDSETGQRTGAAQRQSVGEPLPSVLIVPADSAGLRLDRFLALEFDDYSRSYLSRVIADDRVQINGKLARKAATLATADEIVVAWPPPEQMRLDPETIDLPILYADDDLIAIDKPPYLPVHPGAGTQDGTLVNALLGYDYESFADMVTDEARPGIVHRLDKDTSGVIVVARTPQARDRLSAEFAERRVGKTYLAIVSPPPTDDAGKLETLIGRNPKHRKQMAVVERNGKSAMTLWSVVERSENAALLRVELLTGRTHQIRVHLAHIGSPVVGDELYGKRRSKVTAPRQMLHAWHLRIAHPVSGEEMAFEAPLPEDFLATLAAEKIGTEHVCTD